MLFPLVGVNNRQLIFHMSKILIYINNTGKRIDQFAVGYIFNLILHVKKVLREKVDKCWIETFHQSTMTGIRNVVKKIIRALLHW